MVSKTPECVYGLSLDKFCESIYIFYLFLGHMAACHNLSLMYRKGDGVDQDKVKADKYMHKAQDIHEQLTKERERIKFQEGVESAGGAPLQHWLIDLKNKFT